MPKVVRNPDNILPLTDMQVFASFADDPKIGKDGVFPAEWDSIGVLNDGTEMELNRTIDKNKIKGIGFGVVAVTTKAGELTGSCESLEFNETLEKIAWPETFMDGDVKIRRHSSTPARCHVAFVEEKQNGDFLIRATRVKAIATMENLNVSEDPTGKKVDFDFQSDKDKFVFDEYLVKRDGLEKIVDPRQIRFVDAGVAKADQYSATAQPKNGGQPANPAPGGNPAQPAAPNPGPVTPGPGGQPATPQPPAAATVEVKKKIDLPDDATGGAWALTVGSETIRDLAFNVTPTTLRSKLQAVSGLDDVIVQRSGTSDFTIEFTAASALAVTADGSGLTGAASNTITVTDAA